MTRSKSSSSVVKQALVDNTNVCAAAAEPGTVSQPGKPTPKPKNRGGSKPRRLYRIVSKPLWALGFGRKRPGQLEHQHAHDREESVHGRKESVRSHKESAHDCKESAHNCKESAHHRKESVHDRKESAAHGHKKSAVHGHKKSAAHGHKEPAAHGHKKSAARDRKESAAPDNRAVDCSALALVKLPTVETAVSLAGPPRPPQDQSRRKADTSNIPDGIARSYQEQRDLAIELAHDDRQTCYELAKWEHDAIDSEWQEDEARIAKDLAKRLKELDLEETADRADLNMRRFRMSAVPCSEIATGAAADTGAAAATGAGADTGIGSRIGSTNNDDDAHREPLIRDEQGGTANVHDDQLIDHKAPDVETEEELVEIKRAYEARQKAVRRDGAATLRTLTRAYNMKRTQQKSDYQKDKASVIANIEAEVKKLKLEAGIVRAAAALRIFNSQGT